MLDAVQCLMHLIVLLDSFNNSVVDAPNYFHFTARKLRLGEINNLAV